MKKIGSLLAIASSLYFSCKSVSNDTSNVASSKIAKGNVIKGFNGRDFTVVLKVNEEITPEECLEKIVGTEAKFVHKTDSGYVVQVSATDSQAKRLKSIKNCVERVIQEDSGEPSGSILSYDDYTVIFKSPSCRKKIEAIGLLYTDKANENVWIVSASLKQAEEIEKFACATIEKRSLNGTTYPSTGVSN
jgi:hypothetical protein